MRKHLLVAGCVAASALLALATSGCTRSATAAASAAAVSTAPAARTTPAVSAKLNPCDATAAYAADVTDAGKVAWQVSLPPGQSQYLPSPVISKGVAVFADNDDLVGLRAADGHRLWDDRLRPDNKIPDKLRGLWQWNGNAIALITNSAADWRLVAVNPADGKVRWQLKFGAEVDSWSGIAPNGVFALASGTKLYVLSLAAGRAIWSRPLVMLPGHATYLAELAITDGVLVADFVQAGPAGQSVLAAYNAKTGHKLWARTGMPANPAMQADGGIAFISGANYPKGTMVAAPLTAVSAVTGKTLWHASVGFLYAMWTAPRQLVFGSQSGTYDVNPATGARRWRVPGEASAPDLPADLLLTATNVLYFPNGGVLTDRRPGDGAVAWRQPRAQGGGSGTFIAGPSGPNALIAVSNNFDNAPQTVVYPVNLRTGELAASVKLPSDLPAAPAVTGHDAIYELNPENCIYLGAAGQSPKN